MEQLAGEPAPIRDACATGERLYLLCCSTDPAKTFGFVLKYGDPSVGMHSKTPRGCLQPHRVPNPTQAVFCPMRTYLVEDLTYKLEAV